VILLVCMAMHRRSAVSGRPRFAGLAGLLHWVRRFASVGELVEKVRLRYLH